MSDGKPLSSGSESSASAESERGKPASFDRRTGEVRGSGSGSGGEGNPGEDYDKDPMAGAGAEPLKGPHAVGDSAGGAVDADEGI